MAWWIFLLMKSQSQEKVQEYSITVALQSSSKFDDTNWRIPDQIDKHPLNSKKNVTCLRPICLFLSHNQYNKKTQIGLLLLQMKIYSLIWAKDKIWSQNIHVHNNIIQLQSYLIRSLP